MRNALGLEGARRIGRRRIEERLTARRNITDQPTYTIRRFFLISPGLVYFSTTEYCSGVRIASRMILRAKRISLSSILSTCANRSSRCSSWSREVNNVCSGGWLTVAAEARSVLQIAWKAAVADASDARDGILSCWSVCCSLWERR